MTGAIAPTRPLTALDLCDRCGAQAYVRVLLPNQGELLFCAHHGREHAKALVYHTSHQLFDRAPGIIHVLVGRYHNELRRTEDGWKISKLLLELCWGERRADPTGYLAEVGGPGPTA